MSDGHDLYGKKHQRKNHCESQVFLFQFHEYSSITVNLFFYFHCDHVLHVHMRCTVLDEFEFESFGFNGDDDVGKSDTHIDFVQGTEKFAFDESQFDPEYMDLVAVY